MPPIVPTGAPDSSRGNSATVTMSREDLNALSGDDLRDLAAKSNPFSNPSTEEHVQFACMPDKDEA